MSHALFSTALFLYLVSSIGHHLHLFSGSERARQAAWIAAGAALAAHLTAIGVFCSLREGSVLTGAMPYSLVAFFVALGQFAANFRPGWSTLGSLTMPLAFLAQFVGQAGSAGPSAPASTWLRPHVTVLLLGFAALALGFGLAVLYLAGTRLLKAKQIEGLFRRLPPLESVQAGAHWLTVVGFTLLTLGMITGVIAAQAVWGPRWYLDPHVLPSFGTTLLAWLVYAGYLGVRMLLGWQGRRTTYFLLAGFVFLVVAFLVSVSEGKRPAPDAAPLAQAKGGRP
jgi:ABC-type uncharacterized transport system permease subunit